MTHAHEFFSWTGNIGELIAQIDGVETGKVRLVCSKGKCSPLQYKFPHPAGKSIEEDLSDYGLPKCSHGQMVQESAKT